MRAAAAAAISAAALSLAFSAYGSSFPGGRWYATGFAWLLGVIAAVIVAALLKARTVSRPAKIAVTLVVSALLGAALVGGNTDMVLRRRVEAAENGILDLCSGSAVAFGANPVAGELIYLDDLNGPVMTPDIGGLEVGGLWAFRSPSGQAGCLVQVHSLSFDTREAYGLVYSPGGAPPIGKQWDSYTYLTGDWWVWKRTGAPPGAPM